MNKQIIQKLRSWADQYETLAFISSDPVQFPHSLYDCKASIQDIEISAFVTSWLAYGNRKQIIAKAEQLHLLMQWQPLEYIRSKRWAVFLSDDRTLYRFYKWSDFASLCQRLESVYRVESRSMGQVITETEKSPLCAIIDLFQGVKGIPKTDDSACKRLCMFLRWMVRDNSPVDMGCWSDIISKRNLLIPLDTHVHSMALLLGLTKRKQEDMVTAIEITEKFRQVFPDDPSKGDFALFGYGINNKII